MKKICVFLFLICCFHSGTQAQVSQSQLDSMNIRKLYDLALLDGKSYSWLDHLSNNIGGRLSGSLEAKQADEYS